MSLMKNPIMLALDLDDSHQALTLLDKVGSLVGAIKIGPRLNLKYGAEFVQKVQAYAPVFIDNKYFDITSTVLASIQTSFDSGASFVTIHALNGSDTLQAVAQLEKKLNQIRPFKVLAVTILTSWEQSNLPNNFIKQDLSKHVLDLVHMTESAGLSGIVCSGHELSLFQQENTKKLFKVVPGIRTETAASDRQDQKRVMTPQQALHAGASALVIGRSIINAADPKAAVENILESLKL